MKVCFLPLGLNCAVFNFRPNRMHEMRTIVIDDPGRGVCQSVSLSVMRLRCANTAERIEVLLWVENLGDPMGHYDVPKSVLPQEHSCHNPRPFSKDCQSRVPFRSATLLFLKPCYRPMEPVTSNSH